MARRLLLIALALAVVSSFASAALPLALPSPAQGPRARLVGKSPVTSQSCAECHADIAAEWRGSLHQMAWKDPIFQKSYANESKAFCRGCHAPESDPKGSPNELAQDEGVGCVTCHVTSGAIVGAHGTGASAHPTMTDARLTDVGACASCHQFDFPPDSHQVQKSAMQGTVAEWQSSSMANVSCQECHMPNVVGKDGKLHAKHDFRVAGDRDELARAVTVTAERTKNGDLVVHLDAALTGHAFPTGDMFRRLEVRAAIGFDLSRNTHRSVGLARVFRDIPVDPKSKTNFALQRVEDADKRVGPPGTARAHRDVTLALGAGPDAPIDWEIAYQRMMTPITPSTKPGELEDETIIAAGTVP